MTQPETSGIYKTENNRLKERLRFDEDELTLNRNHVISERQQRKAAKYLRNFKKGFIAAIVVFASSAALLLIMPLLIEDKPLSPVVWIALGSVAGVVMLIGFGFTAYGYWKTRDVRCGKVSMTEGTAEAFIKKLKHGRWSAYYLKIDGVKFQLTQRSEWEAFESGKNYRVFYIDYQPTHIILSAETI